MISPVTARWAALQQKVWVATFLVSRVDNWSPDDYLGAAVSSIGDVLSADVTRGSLVSVRLRYFAPDEETARTMAEAAMRACAHNARYTDALRVVPGRLTAVDRAYHETHGEPLSDSP